MPRKPKTNVRKYRCEFTLQLTENQQHILLGAHGCGAREMARWIRFEAERQAALWLSEEVVRAGMRAKGRDK